MKIDIDLRIAYHMYRMRSDGGLDYIQYDLDGKEVRRAIIQPEINY
jgi:hypothetical protein